MCDKMLTAPGCTKLMVPESCEVDLICAIITHPAGFDVGCAGMISIRKYEHDEWAVEWEESQHQHDRELIRHEEVLEFTDPQKAAECYVELRRKAFIGLDFESGQGLELYEASEKSKSEQYNLLGLELDAFKEKWGKDE